MLDVVASETTAGVEHEGRMASDALEVKGVVIGEQDHGVRCLQLFRRVLDADDAAIDVLFDDVWICGSHVGTEVEQALGDNQSRRFPVVAGVLLVGQTEKEYPAAVDGLLLAVERCDEAAD